MFDPFGDCAAPRQEVTQKGRAARDLQWHAGAEIPEQA
jgi:hypothetical protein